MNKAIPFLKIFLLGIVIAGGILVFIFFFLEEEKEEKDVALVINEKEVTESELSTYMDMIAREVVKEGRGDVSREEMREAAIEQLVRTTMLEEYLEDLGITVSQEEIREELRRLARETPGVETAEEFLDYRVRRGYSMEEVRREAWIAVGIAKIIDFHLIDKVEITEEEIREEYDRAVEEMDEEEVIPPEFEDVKEDIEEFLLGNKLGEKLIASLEERFDRAEVIIVD